MSEALRTANRDGSIGRLGRYALLQNLAKGGMAQVFIAQKDGASEICVLKQLLLELEEHEIAGKRFHREAHVASFLNHRNIARILDAGLEDNTFCIAFEYIAGKDGESMMHRLLSQGRMLPYEVSIAFGLGVLQGLSYAHEAKDPEGRRLGLVHRDLSPRNMMLGFNGDVKIIDFGLAHGQMGDFKTAPGMVLGTLRYVSPEQALTDPIDRRSDLYSLSVVLHEMLTGRWVVQPGKPFEVLKSVISDVPPLVNELNPHLPAALGPVIAKGMAKAPEERWQSAGEFLDALRDAAGALAHTDKATLGDFITELFPEESARATGLVELGRHRFETRMRGASLAPVRPVDLSNPEDTDSRTRTGYMETTRLAEVDLVEPMELTRTAGMEDQTRVVPSDLTLIAPQYPGDAAETLTAIREFSEPEPMDGTNTAVPTVIARDDGQTFVHDRTLANPAVYRGVKISERRDGSTVRAPPRNRATQAALALAGVLVLSVAVLGYMAMSEGSGSITAVIEPVKERRPSAVPGPEKASPPPPIATRAPAPAEVEPPPPVEKPPPDPASARNTGRSSTGVRTTPTPPPARAKAPEPAAPKKVTDGGVGELRRLLSGAELDAEGRPTRAVAERVLDELRAAARKNLPAKESLAISNDADRMLGFTTPTRNQLLGLLTRYERSLKESAAP